MLLDSLGCPHVSASAPGTNVGILLVCPFADEETDTQRSGSLSDVTELVRGRTRIQLRKAGARTQPYDHMSLCYGSGYKGSGCFFVLFLFFRVRSSIRMLLTASNRSAVRASLRERGGYMDMGCCTRLAAGMWLDWDPDAGPVRMLISLPLPPSVNCHILCLVVQLFLSSSSSIATV